MRGIASKTPGLAEALRRALAPLAKRIRAAFLYGSAAKRHEAASGDIDSMPVSDDLAVIADSAGAPHRCQFNLEPGTAQSSIATSRPLPDSVTYIVRMSRPPKHRFVV